MSVRPDSKISNSTFLLTGFPGLERDYPWLSIPFSCIYVMVLSGNCLVLHVICTERSLHEPMFYFLAMLALTLTCAWGCPQCTRCWGSCGELSREIGLDACITQTFFVHGLSCVESGVLLAMAFDRFTAICSPLRYTSILTNTRISNIVVILGRSFLCLLLLPLSASSFSITAKPHPFPPSACTQDLLPFGLL